MRTQNANDTSLHSNANKYTVEYEEQQQRCCLSLGDIALFFSYYLFTEETIIVVIYIHKVIKFNVILISKGFQFKFRRIAVLCPMAIDLQHSNWILLTT